MGAMDASAADAEWGGVRCEGRGESAHDVGQRGSWGREGSESAGLMTEETFPPTYGSVGGRCRIALVRKDLWDCEGVCERW